MSAPVTRAVLRTRIRQRCNMEGSQFVTDPEINDLINVHLTELYDVLVEASPPDYYSTDTTITTTSGTIAYALPTDFRSLIMVYANEGANYFRPLRQLTDVERVTYRAPNGAYSLTMRYVPAPVMLSDDTTGVTGSVDGVSGWEEFIVSMAARDCLMKQESDVSALDVKIERLRARITSQADKRNLGSPQYITDVDAINYWPYPYQQSVNAYQLRGQFIDLFALHPIFP